MSFLRKVRNSISRGNSSTRDSTPNSLRSSSIESQNNYKNTTNKRRDSTESRPDGLQRSETFTIENDKESILSNVKLTKKAKNKFGTYTRTRKTPDPSQSGGQGHEVKNNKGNYYAWESGTVVDPAEAARDPFNFLYEQPSSLQSDLSGYSDGSTSRKQSHSEHSSRNKQTQPIDSSTFKKNRVSRQLREQLEQLKNPPEITEEIENDPDKFRTITINSFRRSFREKFLSKQNEVPHNPSWFVGVDPPPVPSEELSEKDQDRSSNKYAYDNEYYRPTSRSPVRHRTPLQNMTSIRNMSPVRSKPPSAPAREISPIREVHPVPPPRSAARSSVRRTETFRVERPPPEPSIRIEIKNSISPNQPGRMVPVGVAKPMPSQIITHNQAVRPSRFDSPGRRGWNQPVYRGYSEKPGRYQTCIQITSNEPFPINKEPTRVRISGNERSPLRYTSTTYSKRNDQPLKKQIYFGDSIPLDVHAPVKSSKYVQHQFDSNNSRPSRPPTSGSVNRNEHNRYSMTQSIPRRSRSPIKVPWR